MFNKFPEVEGEIEKIDKESQLSHSKIIDKIYLIRKLLKSCVKKSKGLEYKNQHELKEDLRKVD